MFLDIPVLLFASLVLPTASDYFLLTLCASVPLSTVLFHLSAATGQLIYNFSASVLLPTVLFTSVWSSVIYIYVYFFVLNCYAKKGVVFLGFQVIGFIKEKDINNLFLRYLYLHTFQ